MAKYRFFYNDLKPSCSVCFHGTLSADKKTILCPKKGVTQLNGRCWRFRYSPLKHRPILHHFSLKEFSKKDFEL